MIMFKNIIFQSIDEIVKEDIIEFEQEAKWYAETGEKKRIIKQHQEAILNNWETNNRHGIFEMCTGSGKTFTAMCAIRDSIINKQEVPIIIVPSKLLFKQWKEEINNIFSTEVAILLVGGGNKLDTKKIKRYTQNNLNNKRCILTTYQTASRESFFKNVIWGKHIFLVCDEVHNIGSKQNLRILTADVGARIGLSATPQRYFDEKGTKKIIDFFGGIIEPKYQIANAIKDGVLCEYFYNIVEVHLSRSEQEKWNELSKSINKKLILKDKDKNIKDLEDKFLEKLLFERSDIVKKAQQKIYVAEKILIENYKPEQKWLIYLNDSEQVIQLKELLEKHEFLKGNVFEYHTKTENDLFQTINHFKTSGAILLSINCLDEGIDIPSIDHAIILASSKNSRQYIQRRGRVLRKSEGKNFAYIYDCLVSPNLLENNIQKKFSIIRGEIIRAMKFSESAVNNGVKNQIKMIMNNNGIELIEGEL